MFQNTCCNSPGILKLFLQYLVFLQLLLLKYLKDRIITELCRMTLFFFFYLTTNKAASILSCGLSRERGSPANLKHANFNLIENSQFSSSTCFVMFCLWITICSRQMDHKDLFFVLTWKSVIKQNLSLFKNVYKGTIFFFLITDYLYKQYLIRVTLL